MRRRDGRLVLLVASLWLAATPLSGQETTDVAPPPSARFPAAWYPSDNDVTHTMTPVKGGPYEARTMMGGPQPGTLIELEADLRVVGEASTAAEGLRKVQSTDPALVITDLAPAVSSGLRMIEPCRAVWPHWAANAASLLLIKKGATRRRTCCAILAARILRATEKPCD